MGKQWTFVLSLATSMQIPHLSRKLQSSQQMSLVTVFSDISICIYKTLMYWLILNQSITATICLVCTF